MLWYFPSWNGDVRIAVDPKDEKRTLLTIIEPTAAEIERIESANTTFLAEGWTEKERLWLPDGDPERQEVTIDAKLVEVGTVLVAKLKPGVATLTAVTKGDGKTSAMGISEPGYVDWILDALGAEADDSPTEVLFQDEAAAKQREKRKKKEQKRKEKEEKKAATVKRPTCCCPTQIPGEIGPATEVLMAFCTDEQRDQWQRERRLVARGKISGHRYLLAHRHTKTAQQNTKICWDLDDDHVLHFHDWTVPPEEEVLAAKLILEHREPWLRNEATCFHGLSRTVFKNPFGDSGDGTHDAAFTLALGELVLSAKRVGGFLKGAN